VIVILSVVGIILEEIESGIIPINPTIVRVMRVMRIARGKDWKDVISQLLTRWTYPSYDLTVEEKLHLNILPQCAPF